MLKNIFDQMTPYIGTQKVEVIKTKLPKIYSEIFNRDLILQNKLTENTRIHHIKNYKVKTLHFPNKTIGQVEKECIQNKQNYRVFNYNHVCKFSEYLVNFINLKYQIRSSANLYFTQTGQQSLGSHRDRYSVLILQLVGKKKWYIGDFITTTEPGDILYLPVGLEHYAQSIEDSYHVSYALTLPSIFDILDQYSYSINKKFDFNPMYQEDQIKQVQEILENFRGSPKTIIQDGLRAYSHNKELGRFGSLNYEKETDELNLKDIYTVNFDHIITFSKINNHLHIHNTNEEFIIKNKIFIEILDELFFLTTDSLENIIKRYDYSHLKIVQFLKFLHTNYIIKKNHLKF